MKKRRMEISKTSIKKLSITGSGNDKMDTIDQILKQSPGMIFAQVVDDCGVTMNGFEIHLKKDTVVGMPISMFIKLRRDSKRRVIMKAYRNKFSEYFNRYQGQDLNGKKLFIWRTGGLGDLMFAQPIISYLKDKYKVEIHFATAPSNVSLFSLWPKGLIDSVSIIPFDKKFLADSDFHLTFEGGLERCVESHKTNYYDVFKRMAGVEFDINKYPLSLVVDREDALKYSTIIPNNSVMMQMSASTPIRSMPEEKWAYIVDGLLDNNLNVVMIDSPSNSEKYDKFIESNGFDKTKVINLCKFSKSIREGILMLSLCSGFVGIDSSFAHFAEALKVPGVACYGPFPGELIAGHYKYVRYINPVKWNECGKYPCYLHHMETAGCPYIMNHQNPGCLNSIYHKVIVSSLVKNIGCFGK